MSAPDPSPSQAAVRAGPGAPAARQAAFFDLDKTVIAKSSALAMGRELYREGMIPTATVLRGVYGQLIYQLLGADADRMERARQGMLALMEGWEATRVRQIVRQTLEEVLDPLVYAEALELFAEHRAAGRDLYLVSSSGVEIVEPLAAHLGVPNVIATVAGIDADGRYNGTLEFYCYGEEKARAMREEARRRGIDLQASHAYSDSITDLPMLEAVGNPVVVNPDRELRAEAEQRGWPVRDFRRPVALRSRLSQLPRPAPELLVGAGAAGALGLLTYWLVQRRGRPAQPRRPRIRAAADTASRAAGELAGAGRRLVG